MDQDLQDCYDADCKRGGSGKNYWIRTKDMANEKIVRMGVMDAYDRCLEGRKVNDPTDDPLVRMWDRIFTDISGGDGMPDIRVVQFLADRLDGKVASAVDVTSGGEPIKGYVVVDPAGSVFSGED